MSSEAWARLPRRLPKILPRVHLLRTWVDGRMGRMKDRGIGRVMAWSVEGAGSSGKVSYLGSPIVQLTLI